jgi:hypothetical protein
MLLLVLHKDSSLSGPPSLVLQPAVNNTYIAKAVRIVLSFVAVILFLYSLTVMVCDIGSRQDMARKEDAWSNGL